MADEEDAARRKIFDEYGIEPSLDFKTEDVPTEPIPFRIDGESFYCNPWLTGSQFLKFSRMMVEGGLQSVILVETFFIDVMEADEYERFTKFIVDPSHRITSKVLADVFLSLFARYSAGPKEGDRPTSPPRPSSSGRDKTEDGSTESSPSEESTPPA